MISISSLLPAHDGEVPTFVVASALLDLWTTRRGTQDAPSLDDDAFDAWASLAWTVESRFERCDGTISADDLAWIESTQSEALDDHQWAHAVGWGLDLATWPAFPGQWRAGLGSVAVHKLADGELYPVGDWIGDLPSGSRRSVRPSAEPVHPDELPHIRRWSSAPPAGGEAVEVEFHFSAIAEVQAAAEAVAHATIHANGSDDEFNAVGTTSLFPVAPVVADQAARVVSLVDASSALGAGLVVGGEVSLTDDVLGQVQTWLDSTWTGPALTVAGSLHTLVAGEQANVAYAIRRRGPRLEHRKIVPFARLTSTSSPPVREGISPGPRTLRVWHGGWARFSMLICRDVLDPGIRQAVRRAGVNLLAIPTYSDETSSYVVHVGDLSMATQGRVALANNPIRFGGGLVQPTAVFGQPVQGRSSVSVAPNSGASRGLALDRIGESSSWQEIE